MTPKWFILLEAGVGVVLLALVNLSIKYHSNRKDSDRDGY